MEQIARSVKTISCTLTKGPQGSKERQYQESLRVNLECVGQRITGIARPCEKQLGQIPRIKGKRMEPMCLYLQSESVLTAYIDCKHHHPWHQKQSATS